MDVFKLRENLIDDYSSFVTSFLQFRDDRIEHKVTELLADGHLWPEPRIALNPAFEPGGTVSELVADRRLHPTCAEVFRAGKADGPGTEIRLHRHQVEAIEAARADANYVLTTGTGSGKSLAYMVPIVDHVLRTGSGGGIKAIVVYPMNALANSQLEELDKFLAHGFGGRKPVTYRRYTGQETRDDKEEIRRNPPDILLTNYVMLELILTRVADRGLIRHARDLRFLVLDELHTYRGRQGADVSFLVRRLREACGSEQLRCVGTSATMATGSYDERRDAVSRVASELFGAEVRPEHVIGETLRRSSPEIDVHANDVAEQIRDRIRGATRADTADPNAFIADPFTSWVESTFGVREVEGRWDRVVPRAIGGSTAGDPAAAELADAIGIQDRAPVEAAIKSHLMAGASVTNPATGFPVFAFRLHQFISRGDTVYSSIERPSARHLTLKADRTVPKDPDRALLPLAFCRACGQEYYTVFADDHTGSTQLVPRRLGEKVGEQGQEPGFLYIPPDDPKRTGEVWPSDPNLVLERLPDDWLDHDKEPTRVKAHFRKHVPEECRVDTRGFLGDGPTRGLWIEGSFRFCLACGIEYGGRLRSEVTKLATLGSGGRSSALTELSMSSVRWLRNSDLPDRARKVLAFTDNRQDASLQAGHFNDFVMVTLVRAGLIKALTEAGEPGLRHDGLPLAVFNALGLPLDAYSDHLEARFGEREEIDQTLRDVLAYLLYRDLERGWRVTQPNLEQTGQLHIAYRSLAELCEAEDVWAGSHPALVGATPQERADVATVVADFLRRALVIDVNVLDATYQDQMIRRSDQHLSGRFSIDEDRRELHQAGEVLPRSRRPDDYRGHLFLSPRGGVGQYLRRSGTFGSYGEKITVEETAEMIGQLCSRLAIGGILRRGPNHTDEDPTYRLAASAMVWQLGDGETQTHDPLRVTRPPEDGLQPNPYFTDLYRSLAPDLTTLRASEHTAQVSIQDRLDREAEFRSGELPVMYCSPTMELGVDISELNVVGMRNVPPTPANYAQRSGRAGRSGQPALVFTYATAGSPHDQYYFKRSELMVSGRVEAPRIDLANEDLIRAHVQALWLAASGLHLGVSMSEVLDLSHSSEPTPVLKESVATALVDSHVHNKARASARNMLATVAEYLEDAPWWHATWLDDIFAGLERRFVEASGRWWGLYRAAVGQQASTNAVITDHTSSAKAKRQAQKLRREAEKRIDLLVAETEDSYQHDFDPYRYYASEGFLPGYSFPRLPLTAYIPGRRQKPDGDYLQRGRFLAINEFGPRSLIYHEGSRYRVTKVDIPVVNPTEADPTNIVTETVKRCVECGYLHPREAAELDRCERCGAELPMPMRDLFRLQNVSTTRVDRINSDEEERQRQGFEVISGVRFARRDHQVSLRRAYVEVQGDDASSQDGVASQADPWGWLTFGPTATLWTLNLGWRRRKDKDRFGFVLDLERGIWARNDALADTEDADDDRQADSDDHVGTEVKRVVPYVEDSRNVLLIEPAERLPAETLASLESALSRAIEVTFQLEDSELASEALPSSDDRRLLLFYESAEGGAGILRQLVHDPDALARVVRCALELCHVDPDTGEDMADTQCAVACYDCLLSYTNQRDHQLLDRRRAVVVLRELLGATVREVPDDVTGPEPGPDDVVDHEEQSAESQLELDFLAWLRAQELRVPDRARRVKVGEVSTTPDYWFRDDQLMIYVDGPPHDYPDRQNRDQQITAALREAGYRVARFGHNDDWAQVVDNFADEFGVPR